MCWCKQRGLPWNKRNAWYLLHTCCHLSSNERLLVSWQVLESYGVTNYGSRWRKDVVNQCLEFEPEDDYTHSLYCVYCIVGKRGVSGADGCLLVFFYRYEHSFVLITGRLGRDRNETQYPVHLRDNAYCGAVSAPSMLIRWFNTLFVLVYLLWSLDCIGRWQDDRTDLNCLEFFVPFLSIVCPRLGQSLTTAHLCYGSVVGLV